MTTILALSGSTRRRSFNSGLLAAAAELMPDGAVLEIGTITGIPLYDGDLEEADGIPPAAAALKDRIAAAQALLIASPEYNYGVPGVLKNAIDWLSRPQADQPRVFGGKPVAVIGATPGPGGTLTAQAAWLPTLRGIGLDIWGGGRLTLSGVSELCDAEGRLTDEATRDRLRRLLADFVAHIARG